ncbi:unnamed protein product [Effrenium voratum]|nr:unnamed protein product [Effrenium voratum]
MARFSCAAFLLLHGSCIAAQLAALAVLAGHSELGLGLLPQAIGLLVLQLLLSTVCCWVAWQELKSLNLSLLQRCVLAPWALLVLGVGQMIQPWLAWKEQSTSRGQQRRRNRWDLASIAREIGEACDAEPGDGPSVGDLAVAAQKPSRKEREREGSAFAAVVLSLLTWGMWLWTCAGLSVVSASLSLAPASDMLAIRAAGVLLVEVEMDQTLSETALALGGRAAMLLALPAMMANIVRCGAPDAGAAAAVAADADVPSVRQKAASSLLKAAKDGSLEKSLQNFEEKEAEAVEAKIADGTPTTQASETAKVEEAPDAGAAVAVAADADSPSVRQKAASSLLKAAKDGSLEKSLQNFEEKEADQAAGAKNEGPADHLLGVAVDLTLTHAKGPLLKRGPVYGYKFQARWCILTNSQIIVYKDERFVQRVSAERLSFEAKAVRFSRHDAPGEAVKHKAEKPHGFVLDVNPAAGKSRKLSYFDAENEETLDRWLSAVSQVAARRQQAATLHLYDTRGAQRGRFHVAVEIAGTEWSYAACESGTGVIQNQPTCAAPHSYRDAIELGYTALSSSEIEDCVSKLKEEWAGASYDHLKKNCCNFCNALCVGLGVSLPPWVLRLASAEEWLTNKEPCAIIAAAQGP